MIRKRSITIRRHRTSVSLEDVFWSVLETMAQERRISLAALVAEADERCDPQDNLSSTLRVLALEWALARQGDRPLSRD